MARAHPLTRRRLRVVQRRLARRLRRRGERATAVIDMLLNVLEVFGGRLWPVEGARSLATTARNLHLPYDDLWRPFPP